MLTADEKADRGILETDFEWPPDSGRWWRPGAVAEARWLGRWPSAGTYGVWSDSLWRAAEGKTLPFPLLPLLPRLGCDVARFGDDWTAFHCQWGGCSYHHEAYNKQDTMWTVGRLVQLAAEAAHKAQQVAPGGRRLVRPQEIPIIVDDDGVGGGVTDRLREQGYCVRPVRAGSDANHPDDYPNMRSELWFSTADQARRGRVGFALLPPKVRDKLRVQAMAPIWKLDSSGRRQVESKAETKKRTGQHSPDDMDALNLAYLPYHHGELVPGGKAPPRAMRPSGDSPGSKLSRYERG